MFIIGKKKQMGETPRCAMNHFLNLEVWINKRNGKFWSENEFSVKEITYHSQK